MDSSMQQSTTDQVSMGTQVGRTEPKTSRPCPSWCTLPAGHDWDSFTMRRGAKRLHRAHAQQVAEIRVPGRDSVWVMVTALEAVRALSADREDPEAASSLSRPAVDVYWPDEALLGRTASQTRSLSRKLGVALERAAEALEQIETGG